MSLILEALRKREREKQVPERGFLVMAPTPWAAAPGRSLGTLLLAGLVAFGLGVAFMAWRTPRALPPAPPATVPALAVPGHATPGTLLPAPVPTLPAVVAPLPAPRAEPGPPQPVMPASDPTAEPGPAPTRETPPDPAHFVLQAISERDGRPVALISDRLMREGDVWQGARVLRIGDTEVELEVGGQRVTLRF